jgi:hypothetical protein
MIYNQKLWALYHEAGHTKKYYVIRFQKLRKTKKIPRTSGQHYKVYTPRCKKKLFFSPNPQKYSLLSGMYVVYGVLLVLQLLSIARILKDVLKKTVFKCHNISVLKMHELGSHIYESTQIYKNLLSQDATRWNALFAFLRAGYFCYML